MKNVSFTVESGQTTAIVGRTGAGKTSIINLLERFYEPWSGTILVDGLDITLWDMSKLRSRIGLVMQDVFLFGGDISENVTLGRKEISDEKLEDVCRHVNAAYFIHKLPERYRQPVSEGGSTLSAGERQLLSCARAMALDPPHPCP